MIIVSFYTVDTPYEQEVVHLRESLGKLGLRHYIEGVKLNGTWRENLYHKPVFIKQCLEKFQEPVLWIDADAIVVKEPNLLYGAEQHYDIAFALHRAYILNGAVLWFNTTAPARTILRRWLRLDRRFISSEMTLDQTTLQMVMSGYDQWYCLARTLLLPPTYCKIFDSLVQQWCDPVIIQNQASRRFKKLMNRAANERKLLPDEVHDGSYYRDQLAASRP